MLIRSWMFVPGDSERKLEKALESEADALILDLEDAVADQRQEVAREMVRNYLVKRSDRSGQQLWVRINPLDNEMALPDLAAVMAGRPDGIMIPKVNSAKDINRLGDYLSALEAREDIDAASTRIFLCRHRDRRFPFDVSYLSRRGYAASVRNDLGGGGFIGCPRG